eukprot:4038634-Pleurochrysis_carterae.AAC.3
MQLEEEGAVGEAGAIVGGAAKADPLKVRHDHELAPPRGLGRKDAEVDEVQVRYRSASLRARSLASSFVSRVKDFSRSLAGGLPSVCMTRGCPAYAGK